MLDGEGAEVVVAGCIFCGRTPLTREHLWPAWIGRKAAIRDRFDYKFETEADGERTRDRGYQAVPFSQTVRAVCASCNGGWMSDLEAAAKPSLEPLLELRGRRIDRRQQRNLSTWALLKAIVFDELHPDERVVPAEHREFLFEHEAPPPSGFRAWMATYNLDHELVHYAYQGLHLAEINDDRAPDRATAYAVTISVGPVVVLVVGTVVPRLAAELELLEFGPKSGVSSIWPSKGSVTLEQGIAVDQPGLRKLSTAFYDFLAARVDERPPPAV